MKNLIKNFNLFRFFIFCIATYTLSLFFEAGRLISSSQTLEYIPLSVLSLVMLFGCLFIIGYWIYAEEKEKNNLSKSFAPYEWLYKALSMRKEGK